MRPAFVLLIAIRFAAAADASLATYLPPDTKAVIGFSLRQLSNAGLFREVDAEIGKTASSLFAKTPLAGFDPLKDLDEVLIATTGVGEKAPVIVVLRGRFQFEELARDATRYHDTPILESPQHPEAALALIDASTAIAGDPEHVRSAIDRRAAGLSLDASWVSRMETLRNRCGIWGIGEGLENPAAPSGQPGDLSSIDRYEFGVAFNHGLRIAAEIHVRTPQDAEKLATSLRLLETMMKTPKKSAKTPAFDLRVVQETLKFSLILPEAELNKAIAEERGSLAAALSSGLPALLSARSSKAAPLAAATPPIAAAPPVPVLPPVAPSAPAAPPIRAEGKILSNAEGDTVIITLPGGSPVKH